MKKAFSFVTRVFGAGGDVRPSDRCLKSFNLNFEGARNIEWFKTGSFYEAVFYKDNVEFIAVFSASGKLQEYKMYLPFDFLPAPIKKELEKKGEIMNIVLVNKKNSIIYEAIYRDRDLNRYLILLTEFGNIIVEKPL